MSTTKPDFSDILGSDTTATTPAPSQAPSQATATLTDEERIKMETYTDEEIRDVNNIIVNIPDTSTPIVIFFGAQSSGKTMVLLRLLRHLKNVKKLQFEPERVFRPASDRHYTRMCGQLTTNVLSDYAPGGTDIISFMLTRVLSPEGRPICQFLEAPGEHYFDHEEPTKTTFPTYINRVIGTQNRKIWVFLVQPDWGKDQTERNLYAQRICNMQARISPQDRIVFLFNKCDMFPSMRLPNGKPNIDVFRRTIEGQYPGIFNRYQNTGWFNQLLFGRDNFRTICFSAGTFNFTANGREMWNAGRDEDACCDELWNALTR